MNEAPATLRCAVLDFKRQFLIQALKAHGGNRAHTARALGIQRTYIFRLIREFGIAVSQQSRRTGVKSRTVSPKSAQPRRREKGR